MKDKFTTFVNGILEIVKTYKGDWKESNPSSPNYIKNRTHWVDEEKINEIVLNETISVNDGYEMFNTKLYLNMDRTYYVTLDGVEYVCKPWRGNYDMVAIGNGDVFGGEGLGNLDYPFSCDSYIDESIYLNVNSDEGEYHVVIREEGIIETIHTLDEKYLPPMDSDFDKIVDSECLVIVDGGYMDADGYVGTYPSPKVNDRIVLTVGDLTFEGVIRPTDDQYDIVVGNGTLNSERGDGISNGEDFFIHFSAWGESSITRVWFSNDVDIDYYAPVKILAYTDRIKNNLLSDSVGKKVYIDENDTQPGEIFNDYENNVAIGDHAHAEGSSTMAIGDESHAEGCNTVAKGWCSHAEGYSNRIKPFSFYNTSELSDIISSWNELPFTLAYGSYSHAEGRNNLAVGEGSHAEGYWTKTQGYYSHTEGIGTISTGDAQHIEGSYNLVDMGEYIHIVGNGSAYNNRSNAHTLDWNGNAWYQGDLYTGGTSQDDGNKVLSTADINFDSDGNLTITINGVTKKFAPIG